MGSDMTRQFRSFSGAHAEPQAPRISACFYFFISSPMETSHETLVPALTNGVDTQGQRVEMPLHPSAAIVAGMNTDTRRQFEDWSARRDAVR